MSEIFYIAVALGLASLLGFAAHRTNLCTVKAVAEILTTRRAHILTSFAKTVLWVMLVTLVLGQLLGPRDAGASGWALSGFSVIGGFVFGMGAAVNGGCSFSTLSRLADGRFGMLGTLLGLLAGISSEIFLVSSGLIPTGKATTAIVDIPAVWTSVLMAALALWGLWEVNRGLRTNAAAGSFKARLLSPYYRLSTGAALLGVSNAVLFYFFGNWFFTSAFLRTARSLTGAEDSSIPILWAFFAAVLVGMAVSSRQRRAFRAVRPSVEQLARHFLGGCLMGFGAALVPGGNDSLILGGIPGLSPHAIPAYAAIIGGIFMALFAMRSAGGRIPAIDCSGDICASD